MVPVAELASYKNIPVFSWLANDENFDNKDRATTLIRVIHPLSQLGGNVGLFLSEMNWHRLVMIATSASESIAYANSLESTIDSWSILGFNLVNRYEVAPIVDVKTLDEKFQAIKYEARIIILVISDDELRKYMIRADKLGMSDGDYQFIYVKITMPSTNDIQRLESTGLWENGDLNDDDARRGFENLLYVILGDIRDVGQSWMVEANSAARSLFGNDRSMPDAAEPDPYSIFLHDCVMLYGLTLNSTGGNVTAVNGTIIRNAAISVSFHGLSGQVLISKFADRLPYTTIYDLNRTGMFSLVAYQYYTKNNDTTKPVADADDIRWGNGLTSSTVIPSDTPVCGFYNEFCPLKSRIWRKEHQLNNTIWKVKYQDLDFKVNKPAKSFMALSVAFTQSQLCFTEATVTSSNRYGLNDTRAKSAGDRDDTRINDHTAKYKGQIVYVKRLKKQRIKSDRQLLKEMKMDIIENDDIKLDTMFKLSIAIDICRGLEYLNKSELKYHGNMKSTNCVVDSRWTCKLSDFGPRTIYKSLIDETGSWRTEAESLFWTAPEHLRTWIVQNQKAGSVQGDVYSFGIIAKELVTRDTPYGCEDHMSPNEIISKVAATTKVPFRPKFPYMSDNNQAMEQTKAIQALIQRCWAEDPQVRPSVKRVLKTLNTISPFKKSNVIENMIVMMEKYSYQLEELVAERTAQLEDEKRKTDALLYQMLPRKVAEDLKLGKPVKAESFEKATIYFSDIVGFTTIAGECTPIQVVELLNSLYTLFDDTIKTYEVYKVETIGDAYMVVSGLPERNGDKHASEMAYVALDLLHVVRMFRLPHDPESCLRIRIGKHNYGLIYSYTVLCLHSGPVVAGVVGLTMPRYCLFGDTVNTASRMESNGEAMKIHISNATANMLNEKAMFDIVKRGELKIKGKGVMVTYWLEGTKQEVSSSQQSFKPQYYSHLRDDPEQEIKENDRFKENYGPDLYVKINHPDGSQAEQSKLACLDLIPFSSIKPSVQLYNNVHEKNVDI
ncbi:Guanylate cyclase soluble subunit beta-2,Guanylyl cyclase GC-E,Retinal guanylyl cyclase 1,Soluble guanylate cyclase gcy-31,Receptor-type guanylate cyclase gcy-28,Soluble guanylate cyclase gcy-35,Receptor-type guanylate cyclase gcy-4,Guanylate cyclase soluble subunit alpha-1,Receptor-type guanylate cyclase gcy-21,Retinal guanylyl cyclase 2,Heat-stable enterotoxin receptor,Soluble guanylate cyclase 88E,Guanylate cyclase soluble subunit beta-1,Receptor-type guanylate cyclase gcy-13,Receptor-type guanylate cyc|uniref:Guanylate cyclase n=1 Tax=Mytilus coruscus TaxID=42192 RepID=A0A6J8ERN3_MYTCO|nr:Guanylate cyclase soluble subunit beta-2,Guanylyl cyclase GC-E,Retinal guanylyl cyclase 1,Soluble guanylate cyclase gcy-31,Receptor-type guanylate cyclase gcy-28,Soluble guanylate cyclase gcy-35,Receptor-type guanylate cyclase gcy-4,Guanylate cyclase soluble subunit alpha-1,Receptor-type guanylate cyclase gcy-21,Retinal guanylyl cyclase 2,Heat-stable enterotoxin receptor,Soluble guanylate cyclase 88E,Guanylate cyclase soluble subunit beta-1,Receptor-type guanylate cyclase gcy-13,Receptor-type gu